MMVLKIKKVELILIILIVVVLVVVLYNVMISIPFKDYSLEVDALKDPEVSVGQFSSSLKKYW